MRDEDERRARARALLGAPVDGADYLSRFEALYEAAARDEAAVSWADLVPNPSLLAWLAHRPPPRGDARALDVGTGYGDNADALTRHGYEVDAFDVSATAIEHARRRFGAVARFTVADAASAPRAWHRAFDLVVEIYTLQVLPPALRAVTARALAKLVAPGGTLFLLARGRDEGTAPPAPRRRRSASRGATTSVARRCAGARAARADARGQSSSSSSALSNAAGSISKSSCSGSIPVSSTGSPAR